MVYSSSRKMLNKYCKIPHYHWQNYCSMNKPSYLSVHRTVNSTLLHNGNDSNFQQELFQMWNIQIYLPSLKNT